MKARAGPPTAARRALVTGATSSASGRITISPVTSPAPAVQIPGKVLITEISGSESVMHFDHAGQVWVSQAHGIHRFEVGETAQFYFDVGQCMYFTPDGRRIET